MNERMLEAGHLLRRAAGDDAFFREDRDTRAEREQRIQVVRDHHHGEAECGMQLAQQFAEFVGAVRVEARGGLVEQQQRRVHDERERQRHALDHAAGQIRWHARGVFGLQAHHAQLDHGGIADQVLGQGTLLAQREGHVVQHAERREQRAVLEQHAHAAGGARPAHFGGGPAQHRDAALGGSGEPQHLAQQHRLAGARAAHEREDLAAPHGEVEVLVHGEGLVALAEHGGEAADLDHGRRVLRRRLGRGGGAGGVFCCVARHA